jgi:hypothetical protein
MMFPAATVLCLFLRVALIHGQGNTTQAPTTVNGTNVSTIQGKIVLTASLAATERNIIFNFSRNKRYRADNCDTDHDNYNNR